MKTVKVPGTDGRHKVLVYALSTCGWCKKVKSFLKKNSIEYEYVDVDLCSMDDRAKIREDIERRGGRQSFPTIIVDDQFLITGFREEKIKEVLGI